MEKQFVFSTENTKKYQFPTHVNELVMDRSQGSTSEVFVVRLQPGQAPPLHRHDDTEQVFYVLSGQGALRTDLSGATYAVGPGDVVRIPPCTPHSIRCMGSEPLTYVAVDCFLGGRPQAEPTWDAHVRQVCKDQNWDFDQVVKGQ